MDTGTLNERAAKLIIDQLVRHGVRDFSLAPGSRSTPLALAIAQKSGIQPSVHYDERGAAFYALGCAKASALPAVILVTSGTAVGNIFPAVMEASAAKIPLIVLTADRPPEQRDNGANQTADQVKIFGDYVRWQVDLPCPSSEVSDEYLGSCIAHGVFRSRCAPQGPVHFNCMFREPLFGSKTPDAPSFYSTRYEETHLFPSQETVQEWAALLASCEKGVIIAAGESFLRGAAAVRSLAQKLGWPLITDLLSGARDGSSLAYVDLILKTVRDLKAEMVLHFGDRLISKTVLEWVAACSPSHYFHVTNQICRHDPKHQVTHRIVCDPQLFSESLLRHVPTKRVGWVEEWQSHAERIKTQLAPLFSEPETLSEPGLMHALSGNFPANWALFVSASMPVREADCYFYPRHLNKIYANRGISGIDGNIATIAGLAQGAERPLLAVIGDQAFLHDLNSLPLIAKSKYPILLLVINNGGGAIFSFLPIASKKEILDTYFTAAHEYTFEKAAELFDLPYALIETQEDLFASIRRGKSALLEMRTDRQENVQFHQKIQEVCSAHAAQVL